MPDGLNSRMDRRRLLWIALGRQRVGKTALLNAAVQYFRALGCQIEIWNADQQNRTHSLSTFFADAVVPPAGGLADGKLWIEGQLVDQVRRGYHAVLDAGGGWTGFSALIEDVPVIQALEQQGTDVIGLFCVGPEQADLDYLGQFSESGTFLPEKTVIVLNAGLVLSGRSAGGAFAAVIENPTVKAAVKRGAQVVMMPALSCMSEVTDRGLSFADAALGKVKPGQQEMSLFDPVRVNEWWTKKMPAFFGKFPPDWLPGGVSAETSRPAGAP
jgi:hypothetical protein